MSSTGRRPEMRRKIKPIPGLIVESRRSSLVRRKSLDMSKVMDIRMAEQERSQAHIPNHATASRAFDLCGILHKLTMAETHFSHTNRITAPPVVKAARKWRRRTMRPKIPPTNVSMWYTISYKIEIKPYTTLLYCT